MNDTILSTYTYTTITFKNENEIDFFLWVSNQVMYKYKQNKVYE